MASTGRFLLLPYPCASLYTKDGQVGAQTSVRTCASKATPDNAQAVPFQYLFMSGTSFSAPTIAGVAALMLDKDPKTPWPRYNKTRGCVGTPFKFLDYAKRPAGHRLAGRWSLFIGFQAGGTCQEFIRGIYATALDFKSAALVLCKVQVDE